MRLHNLQIQGVHPCCWVEAIEGCGDYELRLHPCEMDDDLLCWFAAEFLSCAYARYPKKLLRNIVKDWGFDPADDPELCCTVMSDGLHWVSFLDKDSGIVPISFVLTWQHLEDIRVAFGIKRTEPVKPKK